MSDDVSLRGVGEFRLSRSPNVTVTVSAAEIVVDHPLGTVHLPAGAPDLVLARDGLTATIPEAGVVRVALWRPGAWRRALKCFGWPAPA
ncbi:hypothetical protein [Dermatobacter hominis]|uniref:hypothetical protein n=1 Tax=Dermatobacter hominis TaxID=2884263 RepID=UPI001D105A9A|nr:hypothetical protein [Dermatobacter hominis]UDY35839.1 hypothetical protein LH044_21290 [Dermatobacter hominis]